MNQNDTLVSQLEAVITTLESSAAHYGWAPFAIYTLQGVLALVRTGYTMNVVQFGGQRKSA